MDHFPIFFNLKNRFCLVVGGGPVAARKVSSLREVGAKICVVAPQLTDILCDLRDAGEIECIEREFIDEDLEGAVLAFAATDNHNVNLQVAAVARSLEIPVNVADDPTEGDFIVPSIINRSPVIAAVSTGGSSPVLSRLIRLRLESLIPSAYGRLAELAAKFREPVKQRFESQQDRRRFWDRILQGGVAERVFSGHMDEAEALLKRELTEHNPQGQVGEVYLVGGGPGDPDLLTFRALRLMQQAEVVVYDRLVAQPILDMTRRDAQRIYVGKERDRHTLRQDEINQLLVRLAKQGKRVVRLKGGDPFIFGRGGEEIDTLAAEGIPFQVIPGITAAAGCASYAGIPLTHRDYAQSVTFITGHLKDNSIDLNWQQLAQPNQTVVFYMGLHGLRAICQKLIEHGVKPSMPAALVQQGTTPKQRVFAGTLDNLPQIVEKEQPKPPTLIIVGEVVRLQEKLRWFVAPSEINTGATSEIDPGTELPSNERQ